MRLDIIPIYENLEGYVEEVENRVCDIESAWNKYAIEPYWATISQWATFDMSDRKPAPVKDITKLKNAINELKKIDIEALRCNFMRAVDELKNYDDDPIVIALYPSCDEEENYFKLQNGVIGSCIYGNIIITINPMAEDYSSWISYVFAHEYHHCVYGNYWYVIHGGLTGKFAEAVITDGLADSFARHLHRDLVPKWHVQVSEEEKNLWKNEFKALMDETEVDYCKCMFGDENANIPWCAGYFFGYQIVQNYMKLNPSASIKELVETEAAVILKESNYQEHNN